MKPHFRMKGGLWTCRGGHAVISPTWQQAYWFWKFLRDHE